MKFEQSKDFGIASSSHKSLLLAKTAGREYPSPLELFVEISSILPIIGLSKIRDRFHNLNKGFDDEKRAMCHS